MKKALITGIISLYPGHESPARARERSGICATLQNESRYHKERMMRMLSIDLVYAYADISYSFSGIIPIKMGF